jgi:hypothetical protein
MKKVKLFEEFINEGKSFQFSFDYNTDEDDVEYIQNILMNAGVDAIAEPGTFDDEMIVKALNAIELRKAKKAIQADGFEINESKKEKMSGATYWEEVNIPGIGTSNTVKANNDSTKAGQALVTYWEKGKSPEAAGFTVKDMASLDLSKAKTGDVITCKFVDGKTDKDYLIKMEVRDTQLGVPNKNIYTWVSRV